MNDAPPTPQPGTPGLDSEARESLGTEAIGFVLAGGQSSRMGTDKALVEYEGRPLIEWAIGVLKTASVPVCIAGSRQEARLRLESYAPVIPDSVRGIGPLAGVCAGLRSTAAAHAIFLPIDVPLMPPTLLQYLLGHARVTGSPVTVASVNAFSQTFPAVVRREALPTLERCLQNGDWGCLAAFRAAAIDLGREISVLPVEVLVQSGHVSHREMLPAVRWFSNVNSASDLAWIHGLRPRPVP